MDERTRRTRSARRQLPAVLALALLLMLGLAACGGEDPKDSVATLSADDTSSDDSSGGSDGKELTEEERQQAMLDFARCMRDHGVDMPDPTFDGDGRGAVMIGGPGDAPASPEVMDAAQEACEPIMKDVIADAEKNMDPEEVQKMQEEALAFAKCMRDHGIDMPDPQFEGGGRMTQAMTGDPNDPAFQAAQEACASEGGGGRFTIGGSGSAKTSGSD